jgi:hypothetical protein
MKKFLNFTFKKFVFTSKWKKEIKSFSKEIKKEFSLAPKNKEENKKNEKEENSLLMDKIKKFDKEKINEGKK